MKTSPFFSIAAGSSLLVGSVLMSPAALAQTDMLTGTVWELQQIQYNNDTLLEADPPENYTLEFMEDGTVGVRADCNVARGTYTAEDSSIAITLGPTTLVACPPESIDTEFLQGLSSAAIYFFEGDDLYLDMMADAGTLKFSPASDDPAVTEETTESVEVTEETSETTSPAVTEEVTEETAEPIRGLW